MYICCLDLEGVLVPEIWIAFAEATGIDELRATTRDVSDYDELMRMRLAVLSEHKLTLADIQKTIAGIDPLPGAQEFVSSLRDKMQLIILSDTFSEFAHPLMQKLGMPTLFCNSLEVSPVGEITGYKLRQANGKKQAVRALQSCGFQVCAGGDSYNDLAMICESDRGFLFRAPDSIRASHPEVPFFSEYDELLDFILSS